MSKKILSIVFIVLFMMVSTAIIISIPSKASIPELSLSTATITLDGESDKEVEINFITGESYIFYALQAEWSLCESESTSFVTLEKLESANEEMVPIENNTITGHILWEDENYEGISIGKDEKIWSAVYSIDKDTPEGEYTIALKVPAITGGSAGYDSYENLSLTSTIVVKRKEKIKLEDDNVTLEKSVYIHDGSQKKPKVTVVTNDVTLEENIDYTVDYSNNIDIGTATITIEGINEYTGTIIKNFVITEKKVISIGGIEDNQDIVYTGKQVVLNGTLTVDNGINVSDLEEIWLSEDGMQIAHPTDVGSYSVKYSYSDEYYEGVYEINFKIVEDSSKTVNENNGSANVVNNNTQTSTSLENNDQVAEDNNAENSNLETDKNNASEEANSTTTSEQNNTSKENKKIVESKNNAEQNVEDLEGIKLITYNCIEGANQQYILGSNKTATFKIDADYLIFSCLYIDGSLVDSSYYKVKQGSTIITLSADYMESLTKGSHTLVVAYANGGKATTAFEVVNKEKSNEATNEENKIESNEPKTGDNIVIFIILAIGAIVGILIIIIIKKKRRAKKIPK